MSFAGARTTELICASVVLTCGVVLGCGAWLACSRSGSSDDHGSNDPTKNGADGAAPGGTPGTPTPQNSVLCVGVVREEGKPASAEGPLGARPRLYLTPPLVKRLKERAAAKETAWSELKQRCDALATAKFFAPDEDNYPDPPNVGQGYQGDEYLPAVMALGLCYQIAAGTDDAAAKKYGAAGDRLLSAMSTPLNQGGQSPDSDSGYGIRYYGVGMATGYDWLYPALSSATRARVVASLNTWIDWYDKDGLMHDAAYGNYPMGYMLAKSSAALTTDGDNPKAAAYWTDVKGRIWEKLIKPTFAATMRGGGWTEGWEYGGLAVESLARFLWIAKTARNLDWYRDLPHATCEQVAYITHFAWPALTRMDDQGTVRGGIEIPPPVSTVGALATFLEQVGGEAAAKLARGFIADVKSVGPLPVRPWQKMLYLDEQRPATKPSTQPLSYVAPGPGHVAMRSAWSKDAIWAAFSSGAYVDGTDSSEQLYNSGSISIVKGEQPIIANATGWLPHTSDKGEELVYNDAYGSDGNGERRLYNVFYVDDSSNPYNPGQDWIPPQAAKTHVERHDDQPGFVRDRGMNLEDMYYAESPPLPVAQWTRDVVYLRPSTFVLYDRTTVARDGKDQWIALHTAAAPKAASVSDATQHRFDLAKGATIGSIRTLLPRGTATKIVALPSGSPTTWRLESHAPTKAKEQEWLTVVTASSSVPEQARISKADGNVQAGDVVGVHVLGAPNQVVLFPADHAGAATTSAAKYVVKQSGDATHVLVDVAPSESGYAVTASGSGTITVDVHTGGPFKPTKGNNLTFTVSKTGQVAATK